MAFNIPRPLPFSDVKFSTIGQDPPLLKRISAADPQLTHNSSPSPPPELHYPSHTDSPRQSSRPTLFQTLTFSQRPELILSDSTQTGPLFRQPSSSLSHESAPMILPRAVPPQTHISPPSHGEPSTRVSATCSNISNPIPSSSVVTPPSAPTEATNPQTHSSYARLRALQTRLVTSLSNLAPPDMSNTLLRVQMANAQSASALTTAHRSHILAQQSLATSREAVAAAQESLNAAEQAQTHANDALVAVKQLASASEATDAEGNLNRHWRVNFTQLQDDLRLFGDWIREREREEASSRQEARRLEAPVLNNDQVEAVTNSDLRQRVWRANGAEGLQRIAVSEAEMVTEGSTAPLVRKISSNQGQIEQATKAWGLETRATNHKIAVDTDAEPMAIDADIAKHLPPETSRDDHSSLLRSFRDQLPESPEEPSVQHSQEEIQHAREEEVRLHAQLEEERARVRELHAQKLEVARFQMMQRQRMDESTENTLDGSRTKIQHAASNGKGADQHQHTQLPGSAIAEAKRALQAHKDRETALAEQLAQKKAETRRLLEERKQRELAELRKREEEERAAEVERAALAKEQEERAAELERAAITKEQELIAEQGRKRQEILALKQRVSAETAARINAERAREKQKNLGVSPQTTSSISQQPPLPAEPVVATKQEPSDTKKKTKTLSGGLKLGPVAPEHEPHSLPPSPGVSRPAQLGLHTSRAQPTHADDTLPSPQLNEHSSHNANATAQSSSQKTIQRTSTPIVDRNSTGNVLATRRSEDAGNVYIACSSQALPMSPEAQAVNLRFIKDRRSAGRETPPHLQKTKSHPGAVTRIPMDENVTIKQESPAPVAFEARKSSSAIPRERDNVEPRSLHTIPVVQESASSQPTTESHDHPEPTRLVSVNELRSKPENAAPIISPVAPSTTIVEATQPDSSRPETLPMHTLPSAPSSNNPHRDNSSLPRINSRPPPTGPSSTRFPVTLDPRTAAADLNNYNDSSQIAPTIQSNDGWDRATDEELYNYRDQESRSPLRTRRRDNDHYSPMPMSISRSCSPSSPRSPVLGKRRYREELRDEPPARRQRHLDRPYGGRSPPRGPSQWRRASPNQPNLQTRMQANDYDMPRSRSDSSREFARRSPSLERPALQSRIGSDVYNIGGGESYRPTYPSGAYSRPQPRTRGAFKSNQPGYPSPSRSRSGSDRSPSLPRGPRRANNPRAAPRSRAGRGGSRALNLEQRISSYDEPSLMNRLRSPPTRPY